MGKVREGSQYMSDVDSLTADSLTTSRAEIDNNILPYGSVITANTVISDAGDVVPVDPSGGAVTVTLASSMVEAGSQLIVKDSGGAAALNNITVATEGTETIDGASSVAISNDYGVVKVVSDGTNWFTL